MDKHTLEGFVAVAETMSFSRAAQILFVTQPALSRKIAALEIELGIPLLIRSKPSIRLTPAGTLFYQQAKRILALYDETYFALSHMSQGRLGKLRIGYINISQFSHLCGAALLLRQEHPGIELTAHKYLVPDLYQMLRQGSLDVIFDRCSLPVDDSLCSMELPEGPLYAVLYRDHPLAHRQELALEELSQDRFVMFERGTAPEAFDFSMQLCMAHGFTMNIVSYGNNLEDVMLQVGIGVGVTVMDEAARVMESEYTRFVPIREALSNAGWYVLWRKDNENPCIPLLTEALAQALAEGQTGA